MIQMKHILSFVILLLISSFIHSCTSKEASNPDENEVPDSVKDYQNIIEKGKLVVLAENSSTSYFIYRGEKMGFEYEILREFTKELGIDLEVITVPNLDNLIPMLNNKEGDIISCNYTITRERTKLINFSLPYIQSPQVLVQRKPEGWQKMEYDEMKKTMISEPVDLRQKHISVWENSSYFQRLIHLQEEIGDSIHVDPVNGMIGTEELIEQVAQGIIDYTITEENIAKVNSRFYNNIDISTEISVKQNIAFGLRKESSLLKAKLDKWLEGFLTSKTYKHIYRKYYEIGISGIAPNGEATNFGRGRISPFDDLFRAAGKRYNVDWLITASIAYHESRFNPYIEGFGGAYGLMQFMPNTGPKYDVYPDSPPEVQINGGTRKIANDIRVWSSITDMDQRIKFALASYNAGLGHVQDAQRLAEKYGLDPQKWDGNVEKMILNLSKQEYYRDEVVKSGALRGVITSNYVKNVFERYRSWKTAHH